MLFPEDYFPIENSKIEKDFYHKVKDGLTRSQKLNVLFCATCKDVEKTIKKMVSIVSDTGKIFNNYDIFLYENNSSDNTVETIRSLENKKIILQSETISNGSYERSSISLFDRCRLIANARNKYVEFINNNKGKYDYIFIFDADIEGGWSNEGIMNSIFYIDKYIDIGCISSYCVLASVDGGDLENFDSKKWLMYDSFAFRFYGTWDFPSNISIHNHIKVRRGTSPVLVNSNFNGLAIYKPECFLNNKYDAVTHGEDSKTDCDHVCFHKTMYRNGFKVFINPSMITSISNHKYSKGIS